FTMHGAPAHDRATGELARYHVRIIDGTSEVTDRTALLIPHAESPVHVKLAYAHHAPRSAAITSTVTGRILHAGRPLADARVRVLEGDATTRTRRDGTFAIAVATRGALVLHIDHPTGLATARAIFVRADTLALTVELATTGTIAGVALDRAGKPLTHGLIQLRSRDTAVERFVAPGRGGHFALDNVELEQTYDLAVTDGDTGEHATREITLDAARPNVTALHVTTGR
ncbi:MAG: hypothetical protein H0T79_06080, partial [Deltaproteobacteria bacterium]|nr:hypothetical protein [Deltaproteobacteria bacterium]